MMMEAQLIWIQIAEVSRMINLGVDFEFTRSEAYLMNLRSFARSFSFGLLEACLPTSSGQGRLLSERLTSLDPWSSPRRVGH